ncbi:MAG: glucose 1-dehydrogenase [Candidatus Omnitrophica bacterium]|nr:glucose 1-dehydrogenase [Candidatus Omnitrophota bacterium]
MGAHAPHRPHADNRLTGALFDLTGRVALVTGASRGLGAAMARALAEAGASLVLWARDARALERQTQALQTGGTRVLAQRVDVTDQPAVRRALRAAIRRFGRIDILVNNAGIWRGDAAVSLPRRDWDAVLATDLSSVFFVSQAVAPTMMRRRYGKIINVASTSGVLALPHGAAYGTVKAGLMHLTRILAVEWGPYGIRVTGIAPGVFRTDMTREVFADRAWYRRRTAEIPLGRFGEPDDLGGLVVFLASRASDHITGQTIIIDGGGSLTV